MKISKMKWLSTALVAVLVIGAAGWGQPFSRPRPKALTQLSFGAMGAQ